MTTRTDSQRRKDKKRKATIKNAREKHTLTKNEWYLLRLMWGFRCAYCGVREIDAKIEKDCVVPIARGGYYTLENVVPACRSCNARKAGKTLAFFCKKIEIDLLVWRREQVVIARAIKKACHPTSTSDPAAG